MKTIEMLKDFSYRVKPTVHVQYLGGKTYDHVPEFAVREILKAQAGRIIQQDKPSERPIT